METIRKFLLQVGSQLREFWTRLNLTQRVVVITIISLFLLALVIGITIATKPRYTVLFSNLSADDSAAIIERLKGMGVPYQIRAAGATILVPEKVVHETRLTLAAEGLPKGVGVGFEIFDQIKYTLTEFTQRVQYLRALQNELARTIIQLEEIEHARVHLVIPTPELYIDREEKPTASVVIKLKPGKELREEQIRGIVHLVSHAVEGLEKEDVEVIDIHGNILTDVLRRPIGPTKLEAQRDYERHLESRIKSMVSQVLGPNTVVARVNSDLDFSKREEKAEIYKPVVDEEGIPRSTQKIEERFKGTGVGVGGVPGVTTNIPGYPAIPARGEYERREEIVNLEISKIETHTIEAPGKVNRLSVALIVDSDVLKRGMIEKIKQAAIAAAGLRMDRGDQVAVVSMPFSKEAEIKARKEAEARERMQQIIYAAAVGLIILLVILIYFQFRPRAKKVEEFIPKEALPIEKLIEELPPEETAPPLEKVVLPEIEIEGVKLEELPPEERKRVERDRMLKEIIKMLEEKPKEIVNIFKNWLLTER